VIGEQALAGVTTIAPMAAPRYPIDLGAPICPMDFKRLGGRWSHTPKAPWGRRSTSAIPSARGAQGWRGQTCRGQRQCWSRDHSPRSSAPSSQEARHLKRLAVFATMRLSAELVPRGLRHLPSLAASLTQSYLARRRDLRSRKEVPVRRSMTQEMKVRLARCEPFGQYLDDAFSDRSR
jgi:hypothetical protein